MNTPVSTAIGFDREAYKLDQLKGWDATAPGWRDFQEVSERQWRAVGEKLLERTGVKAGDRVLDVATGVGEPALRAASRVGPKGRVLGLDLSPTMIALARTIAADRGLTNVEFRVMDADELTPGSLDSDFDAAVCRWGLMFFADLPHALAAIRDALRLGGRFAACTVGRPEEYPFIGIEVKAIVQALDLPMPPAPPPGTPGFYSLSDPTVLSAHLERVGFTDIYIEHVNLTYEFKSGDEFADWQFAISAPINALLDQRPKQREVARQAVASAIQEHADSEGHIRFRTGNLVAVATRGA